LSGLIEWLELHCQLCWYSMVQ